MQRAPSVIIIGAGPSAIAMAYKLKHELFFDNWILYEKSEGPGGTWRTNTYPGVGCDVPTHLYSFSFDLNPDWSKELCDGPEILSYMERTCDRWNLSQHMLFSIECLGARWLKDEQEWEIQFRDLKTSVEFVRRATVLISAVGGINKPREVKFEGMSNFRGHMFHTARWDHSVDYTGKRMAVIGNGCSAAQVVPTVSKTAATLKQYARSPQWYHERPNRPFTAFEKWCFRWIPLWARWERLKLFLENDALVETYMPGPLAAKKRTMVEENAKKYIHSMVPEKYRDFIVPDFPLGCKRRIFDPGYLESLNAPNVELIPEGIKEITEDGVISENGSKDEFDIIILATGFQVQNFLTPMDIVGEHGVSLRQRWKENRAAQAYLGTTVSGFPNFGILFGPNTFPAHNSALYSCEVQVEYFARTILAPIIDRQVKALVVHEAAETFWVNSVQKELVGSVFEAGCSNWYITEGTGRNAASFPGYARDLWKQTWLAKSSDYDIVPGDRLWPVRRLYRWLKLLMWRKSNTALWIVFFALLLRRSQIRRRLGVVYRVALQELSRRRPRIG
ncbi:monooxygenase [Viridothelium virens]|uniref:Monooxygenase n=1 Tax=Viridothelium virens TaxID=1048519 RepID=A0A6A6H6W0_VIRVR|nr:monooxygenase [Viridothelium virens]